MKCFLTLLSLYGEELPAPYPAPRLRQGDALWLLLFNFALVYASRWVLVNKGKVVEHNHKKICASAV